MMNRQLRRTLLRGYRVLQIAPQQSGLLAVATPFETSAVAIRSVPSGLIIHQWMFVFGDNHVGCSDYLHTWVAFVSPQGKALFTLRADTGSYAF